MRIALLYSGPYRGNSLIVDNHLKTFGDDVDIYVSCFEHYLEDWKNSEFNVKQFFITPKIEFNSTDWSKFRNDLPGQSGFWQFWNIKNIIENVPKDYDLYIKNRNDLIFDTKFNPFKSEINVVYSPNISFHRRDWDIDNWINDEVLVFNSSVFDFISSFVTDFYKKNRHPLNDAGPYFGSNEASLRTWLSENNITVKKIIDLSYTKNHNGVKGSSGHNNNFTLENF